MTVVTKKLDVPTITKHIEDIIFCANRMKVVLDNGDTATLASYNNAIVRNTQGIYEAIHAWLEYHS